MIFCTIMKSSSQRGKKCVMIVRGRELVSQASKRLAAEGVDHGVLMAGYKHENKNVQVCSIDTILARGVLPEADLIVLDEAHFATSDGYKKVIEHYKNSYLLAVSATPHCKDGLSHIADNVVYPISINELMNQGYLARPQYYSLKTADISGVKIRKGDFDETQLANAMNLINGDIVENWQKLGENRPTIIFACSVKHSLQIKNHFEKCGIKTEHIDASTKQDEREATLKKLERGEIQAITNCGILCTGVDMPFVSCVVLARPTKSYNLHIQQIGRGTRIYNGKKDFIVLDNAGNLYRHGIIENEKKAEINPTKPKKSEIKIPSIRTCEECFAVFQSKYNLCPRCGVEQKEKLKELLFVNGELQKISDSQLEQIKISSFLETKKQIAKEKGYKRGWIFFQLKEQFGEKVANEIMPKRIVPDWVQRGTQ